MSWWFSQDQDAFEETDGPRVACKCGRYVVYPGRTTIDMGERHSVEECGKAEELAGGRK